MVLIPADEGIQSLRHYAIEIKPNEHLSFIGVNVGRTSLTVQVTDESNHLTFYDISDKGISSR